jgi:hypothetical protein
MKLHTHTISYYESKDIWNEILKNLKIIIGKNFKQITLDYEDLETFYVEAFELTPEYGELDSVTFSRGKGDRDQTYLFNLAYCSMDNNEDFSFKKELIDAVYMMVDEHKMYGEIIFKW